MFPKIGVPPNGWFIMENPIKMDDLGETPLFLETPIWERQAAVQNEWVTHLMDFVALAFFSCSLLNLKQFQKMTGVLWVTLEGLQPFQDRSCAVPDADVGGVKTILSSQNTLGWVYLLRLPWKHIEHEFRRANIGGHMLAWKNWGVLVGQMQYITYS